MKIAIQGHPTRGKEVIQILESLGGINTCNYSGNNFGDYYELHGNSITCMCTKSDEYKYYTLEEFEKEFPFKVGDKVVDYEGDIAVITGFAYIEEKLGYSLQYENGRGTATPRILKHYKEMKEERNIKLTLNKAKEWYKKGGELKEIALQAFTEQELNPLPRSWEEFCKQSNPIASWRYDTPIKYKALFKLEQLRDCWWNGWKPKWDSSAKYVIKWDTDDLTVFTAKIIHSFLVFPTREMAEEFLECFRDLIEKAGDLI